MEQSDETLTNRLR